MLHHYYNKKITKQIYLWRKNVKYLGYENVPILIFKKIIENK